MVPVNASMQGDQQRAQGPQPGSAALGAAGALRQAIGAPRPPNEQAECDRALAGLRADLGEEAFVAAWTEGRALPLEEAIAAAPRAELPAG